MSRRYWPTGGAASCPGHVPTLASLRRVPTTQQRAASCGPRAFVLFLLLLIIRVLREWRVAARIGRAGSLACG